MFTLTSEKIRRLSTAFLALSLKTGLLKLTATPPQTLDVTSKISLAFALETSDKMIPLVV